MLLLLWLQTPSLEVILTTLIPCLEVSLLLIFRRLQCVQISLSKIVANKTKYSYITPVIKGLH